MLSTNDYLSDYVTYGEAIASDTAAAYGIDNQVTDMGTLSRMCYVANHIFDPVRRWVDHPLGVNSFYRCLELNRKLRSSDRSDHLRGGAIDIDADVYPGCPKSNAEIFVYIMRNFQFKQLIWEGPVDSGDIWENCKWVHVAAYPKNARGKLTLYNPADRDNPYRAITPKEQDMLTERFFHATKI